MAVAYGVQEFLRRANVPYAVYPHETAYTALADAAVMNVADRNWAKVVVCFADNRPIQAVIPANCGVDLDLLQAITGAKSIRLAHEDELRWLFPECELGAMPPFGAMYRQHVYVDERLAREDEIVFNGGTHHDAVAMQYRHFERLANPTIGRFAHRIL